MVAPEGAKYHPKRIYTKGGGVNIFLFPHGHPADQWKNCLDNGYRNRYF
jgi:hypothetical protein